MFGYIVVYVANKILKRLVLILKAMEYYNALRNCPVPLNQLNII